MDAVERHLFSALLGMGSALLGYFFGLVGQGDQGPQVVLKDGQVLKRLEGERERRYVSVFGEFILRRFVYAQREGQRQMYVPVDARLQLPASEFSYVLQDWGQRLAVEFSFHHVWEVLKRVFEVKLPVSALERMSRSMGEAAEVYAESVAVEPAAKGELVVVQSDGKGVPMRKPAATAPIRAHDSQKGPKPDRKKMAVVGAVYDIQRHIRTPEQVLEALFHTAPEQAANDVAGQPKVPRPVPIAKAVRASLTHTVTDGTEINAREVIFP